MRPASFEEVVDPAQLHPADGGGEVGHPRVVAERRGGAPRPDIPWLRSARARLRGLRVAADEHPALAGGHRLRGIEADRGQVGQRAGRLVAVARALGLAGVLQDQQAVVAREPVDRVHVRGMAVQVHRDDRRRPGGHRSGGRGRIEAVRRRVDVREHRAGAGMHHGVGRGGERERRHDDLVARADARRHQAEVQRRGPRGQRDALAAGHGLGELGLEGGHLRALGQHAAGQDPLHGLALGRAEDGFRDRHGHEPTLHHLPGRGAGQIRTTRRQAAGRDCYTEVRYEDLVAEPADTLRRVCAAIELDYDPAMLDLPPRSGRTG